MRLTAMESLTESKARKRASLIDDDESPKNSKKRWSSGSDTLQIKETGGGTSEARNGNASCSFNRLNNSQNKLWPLCCSYYKTNSEHSHIDFFHTFCLHFWFGKYVRYKAIQLFHKNATIAYLLKYLPFQNINKNIHGLYFSH